MKFLFYVSGHGLGHATRVLAVMKALRAKAPHCEIYLRAHLFRDVFGSIPAANFHVSHTKLDVGVIEKDLFSQDVYETLQQYAQITAHKMSLMDKELSFIREERINVVISDIPPMASEIGRAAGIPTLAIGNFSWDFIYLPYVHKYPEFASIIEDMQSSYSKTDLLLRLPLHHEMIAFPHQQDIPLIVRQPMWSRETIRSRLKIRSDDNRHLLLVALRTENAVSSRAIQELINSKEYIVLSFFPLPVEDGGSVRILNSEWQVDFPDLIRASDVVISKLGYGIVSECIVGQTPLLYVPRVDFAEFAVIKEGLKEILPSYLMPKEDFLEGYWYRHIKDLLANDFTWPSTRVDGANVASDIILNYAR